MINIHEWQKAQDDSALMWTPVEGATGYTVYCAGGPFYVDHLPTVDEWQAIGEALSTSAHKVNNALVLLISTVQLIRRIEHFRLLMRLRHRRKAAP